MQAAEEGINSRGLIQGMVEQRQTLWRPRHHAGGQIPIPGSNVTSLGSETSPLLAVGEFNGPLGNPTLQFMPSLLEFHLGGPSLDDLRLEPAISLGKHSRAGNGYDLGHQWPQESGSGDRHDG